MDSSARLSALVDRFAQHCHIFDIDAEFRRDKDRRSRRRTLPSRFERKLPSPCKEQLRPLWPPGFL